MTGEPCYRWIRDSDNAKHSHTLLDRRDKNINITCDATKILERHRDGKSPQCPTYMIIGERENNDSGVIYDNQRGTTGSRGPLIVSYGPNSSSSSYVTTRLTSSRDTAHKKHHSVLHK